MIDIKQKFIHMVARVVEIRNHGSVYTERDDSVNLAVRAAIMWVRTVFPFDLAHAPMTRIGNWHPDHHTRDNGRRYELGNLSDRRNLKEEPL